MGLRKSSGAVLRYKRVRKPLSKEKSFACTLPAAITPAPFATKEKMLNFIAAATEGIPAQLKDGTIVLIKI